MDEQEKKKRVEDIKKLIEKHSDKISTSERGKIEINFCGRKISLSITTFDEINSIVI